MKAIVWVQSKSSSVSIPAPKGVHMKLETYLNAMQFAQTQSINLAMLERLDPCSANLILLGRRSRQWLAFCARIIRMDKDKDEEIEYLIEYGGR